MRFSPYPCAALSPNQGRAATDVELADGLMTFYEQKARHLANPSKVAEILRKNKGKEAELYVHPCSLAAR